MKILVITNNHGVYLTEQHLEWLHKNGHPEADERFCNDDRSNPALIACIEAVHEQMQPLVNYAENLRLKVVALDAAAAPDMAVRNAALDNLCQALRDAGCTERMDWYIHLEVFGLLDNNARWHDAEQRFQRRWPKFSPNEDVRACYEHLRSVCSTLAIDASKEAKTELGRYCEQNNIISVNDGTAFAIDDGFAIVEYDETRFQAAIKEVYDDSTCPSANDCYETLELTPFITRDVVDGYVRAGNTDGLMAYLKSLGMNVQM